MPVVITNCTNRKRVGDVPAISASSLVCGTLESVAEQWKMLLRSTQTETQAKNVYCGRSFREAEASAEKIDADFYAVSAGLGVISSKALIPTYDLTVSIGSTNSISVKIFDKTTPPQWWSFVSNGNPYGSSLIEVINKHPNQLILIALSRPYIELIIEELALIDTDQIPLIRFFGKQLDQVLPESLVSCWMPYDDRLDSLGNGYAGTQSDMAQRALNHFVTEVLLKRNTKTSAQSQKNIVLEILSTQTARNIPIRTKLSDTEIYRVIHKNWSKGRGQSSELLRMLRHDLGIACEQSRFRIIYHSVKASVENK